MKHIIGGYFLVEGVAHAPWLDVSAFPDMFWSISDCIATVHPHVHLLSWSTKTTEELHNLKQDLQLSGDTFAAATDYIDACFNENYLGWPSVWLNPEHARTFAALYLKHRNNVKLLGIALPETDYQKAIDEYTPVSEQDGETGLFTMLKRYTILEESAASWGYEILGSEVGGGFHSFACHGLENAYARELHLPLNSHGLISAYTDVEKATQYTNLETTATEPVLWLPWLVFEMPMILHTRVM